MTGGLVGLLVGLGLVQVYRRVPWRRRATLADRVEPYVHEATIAGPALTGRPPSPLTPFPTLERILAPVLARLSRRVGTWLGGSADVRRRLVAAGLDGDVEMFRLEQVIWGAAGALTVLVLLSVRAATGVGPPAAAVTVLLPTGILGGILGRDWWLTQQVRRREEAMVAELPTVAELLALAVTAGESAPAALGRVARSVDGELGTELGRALAATRAGTPLVAALESMATRTGVPSIARFVDGLAIAVERGTPLSEVLRAQAADAREEGKRALLASAGAKELAMLVPVVFLILPVTVLFALYPGLVNLQVLVH